MPGGVPRVTLGARRRRLSWGARVVGLDLWWCLPSRGKTGWMALPLWGDLIVSPLHWIHPRLLLDGLRHHGHGHTPWRLDHGYPPAPLGDRGRHEEARLGRLLHNRHGHTSSGKGWGLDQRHASHRAGDHTPGTRDTACAKKVPVQVMD